MERNRIDEKKSRKPAGAALKRPELTQALYRALFEEWAERGYAAISLERVASRAQAGKAAIYRRWPSKLLFCSDAIKETAVPLVETPDCGSLQEDVQAFLLNLRRVLRHPLVRRILPDLEAERARGGEITSVLDHLAAERRARFQDLINRAVSRGELGQTVDRDLILDTLPAPLYWRMIVRGQNASRTVLHTQANMLAAALREA